MLVCPNIFVSNFNLKNKNILLLFGWTASNFSDIKKKHILLQNLNINSIITVVTPITDLLFNKKNMIKNITNINKLLNNYIDCKIYIIYYSGGGSVYYPLIHDNTSYHNLNNISGEIFDSAPVPFKMSVFINWICSKFDSKFINPILIFAIKKFAWLCLYIFFNCMMLNPILYDYNDLILKNKSNGKVLILSSNADLLVPLSHVQNISNKHNYSLHVFNGSDHLEHDTIFPNEYFNQLNKFINPTQ